MIRDRLVSARPYIPAPQRVRGVSHEAIAYYRRYVTGDLITHQEVAAIVGVHHDTLTSWIQRGILAFDAIPVAGMTLYRRAEVDAYMAQAA
jgi:excisionase family DNA binding protein